MDNRMECGNKLFETIVSFLGKDFITVYREIGLTKRR